MAPKLEQDRQIIHKAASDVAGSNRRDNAETNIRVGEPTLTMNSPHARSRGTLVMLTRSDVLLRMVV